MVDDKRPFLAGTDEWYLGWEWHASRNLDDDEPKHPPHSLRDQAWSRSTHRPQWGKVRIQYAASFLGSACDQIVWTMSAKIRHCFVSLHPWLYCCHKSSRLARIFQDKIIFAMDFQALTDSEVASGYSSCSARSNSAMAF